MSIEAINWVLPLDVKHQDGKTVLMYLANKCAPKTGVCWLELDELARMSGQTRRTVQRQIQKLVAQDLLEVYERRKRGKSCDGYRLSGMLGEYEGDEAKLPELFNCDHAWLKCHVTCEGDISAQSQVTPATMSRDNDDNLSGHPCNVQVTSSDCTYIKNKPYLNQTKPYLNQSESTQSVSGLGELVQVWNSHCGDLPQLEHFDQSRPEAVGLQGLLRKMGLEKAKNTLRDATLGMASDSWHAEKGLGLAFLLKGQKYYQLAEKHRAAEKKSKPRQYTDRELLEGVF